MTIRIIDVIPAADSRETDQNSEPSIAINPVDTNQIIAGSFSASMSFYLTPMAGRRGRITTISPVRTNRSPGSATAPVFTRRR
jgi:hypothetical protein